MLESERKIDISRHSIANTRHLLREQFPNLEWKESKGSKDHYHVFDATFDSDWWHFTVEVTPVGCMARLLGGRSVILRSPNEQGWSLEEVVAEIRKGWDELAHSMSSL
jgi:hypothetical protein